MTAHQLHPAQLQGAHHIAEFLRPRSIDEAVRVLADRGSRARIIAGGTDLLLELDRGARRGIDTLVDLSEIPDLDQIRDIGDELVIGCLVTHGQVVASPLVSMFARPLVQACGEIGAPQLRNRATIVGNIVTASPANDTITPLRALDATVEVTGVDGSRSIPFAAFHTGFRSTALVDGDVVTAIRVPKMRSTERGVFAKLGLRKAQAISVLHATAILDFDGDVVLGAKIAIGSATPVIVRADGVETELVGAVLSAEAISDAANRVHESIAPIDDVRADATYRSEQAEHMLRRMLASLAEGGDRDQHDGAPVTLWAGSGDHRWVRTGSPERTTDETPIRVTVNGRSVEAAHAAGMTLLHWLRDVASEAADTSLTGTKEGCAEGECGACTVLMDGNAVVSCLVSAAQADGRSITTIEGVAGDGSHDVVQEAFLNNGAVQCGYCIPGFVMSVEALRAEHGVIDRATAVAGLAGNLCRCTGYYKIIDAVIEAGGDP
ncbi:Xanthine dehydrogenase iron-sulfur subunit / Xanthine dehydrogenase, FAD binding subunit [hydrothermal vent metagenome]|uniref:Xanthine dehydrogenase iron-sulfur subunit / Xanthine dehydrogenase, FAD binding subunit n=1 Tax=hydrothermal vent metagenome TaxID=652676 RepID=A0A3B0SR12_9ZZZZ